jgi:hypothetical protein
MAKSSPRWGWYEASEWKDQAMRLASFVARPIDMLFQADGDAAGRRKAFAPRAERGGRAPATVDVERLLGTLDTALGGAAGGKIVVVASARPGEGKTTVVVALARYAAAQRGRRVLVVDTSFNQDLGRRLGDPTELAVKDLAQRFAGEARPAPSGAGEVIVVRAGGGACPGDAGDLHPDLLTLVRQACDYVFVECPAFAQSASLIAHARSFDGMVVVVEAGRTRWPVVQHLREQFEAAGGTVLGVVLNRRRYFVPRWLYRRL